MAKFKRKPLHKSVITRPPTPLRNKLLWRGLVILLALRAYASGLLTSWAKGIMNGIAYIAGSTIGQQLDTDKSERVNILLAGYGGGGHDGALLTDTMIVASLEPSKHRVTMVSIPRDLIVKNASGDMVKLNAIMSDAYLSNGAELELAVSSLLQKLEQITDLAIPYYMMIDFDGFIKVVDDLGGIDVYVPQHFLDREYPVDRNGEVEIFELPEGENHLSGPNTLKYARSRHSTSDFSRSERQQQIIKAILKKLVSTDNLTVGGIQKLFDSYATIIKTNITHPQLIGLLKYGVKMPEIIMYGLTSQCILDAWRINPPGCVLRDAIGGLLPREVKPGDSIDRYTNIRNFVHFVLDHPTLGLEQTPLTILNATDKTLAENNPELQGIAAKTANKLVDYGFNVVAVTNASVISTGNSIETYGGIDDQETLDALAELIDYEYGEAYTGVIDNAGYTHETGIVLYLGSIAPQLTGSNSLPNLTGDQS